jgi:hypothetical protein
MSNMALCDLSRGCRLCHLFMAWGWRGSRAPHRTCLPTNRRRPWSSSTFVDSLLVIFFPSFLQLHATLSPQESKNYLRLAENTRRSSVPVRPWGNLNCCQTKAARLREAVRFVCGGFPWFNRGYIFRRLFLLYPMCSFVRLCDTLNFVRDQKAHRYCRALISKVYQ